MHARWMYTHIMFTIVAGLWRLWVRERDRAQPYATRECSADIKVWWSQVKVYFKCTKRRAFPSSLPLLLHLYVCTRIILDVFCCAVLFLGMQIKFSGLGLGTFLWYTFVAIVSILLNLIPRAIIMPLGPKALSKFLPSQFRSVFLSVSFGAKSEFIVCFEHRTVEWSKWFNNLKPSWPTGTTTYTSLLLLASLALTVSF